jgi:dsRNA-specific ribonuclease
VRLWSKKKRIVETDYKSKLQEIIQKRYKLPPYYVLAQETGPDHNKVFQMEVRVRQRLLGQGEGHSKKEAEQSAAYAALKKIRAHRLAKKIDPKTLEDEESSTPVRSRKAAV